MVASVCREHLGLLGSDDISVQDPLSDQVHDVSEI